MNIQESEKTLKQYMINLEKLIQEYIIFFNNNPTLFSKIKDSYKINVHLLNDIQEKATDINQAIKELKDCHHEQFFKEIRIFLLNHYGFFIDLLRMVFYQIIFHSNKVNIVDLVTSTEESEITFIAGNYLLLTRNFKTIKNIINQFFFKDIKLMDELVVNDDSELWLVSDMAHEIFPSDINRAREFTTVLLEPVENIIKSNESVLLHQQVSELLKNAIKHGNKMDQHKIVKAWYKYKDNYYKVIIEDQGDGFKKLDDWNAFNKKRNMAIARQNVEEMMQYIAYKTESSDEDDGGNALFAALEYWDSGLIYNTKKNKVLAIKYFFTQ